jgi:hypothetical protein
MKISSVPNQASSSSMALTYTDEENAYEKEIVSIDYIYRILLLAVSRTILLTAWYWGVNS